MLRKGSIVIYTCFFGSEEKPLTKLAYLSTCMASHKTKDLSMGLIRALIIQYCVLLYNVVNTNHV